MDTPERLASYRRILKTSFIVGGGSVINVVIGLARTKIVAVLLGPAGVGLVSLYSGLIASATAMASLGIGTVGARHIAEAQSQGNVRALDEARRVLFWGALLLSCVGAMVVWLLRSVIAIHVLGGAEHASTVGWLAFGVALSVAGASQGALIQGMRRIKDMARLSVYGSVLNTVVGGAVLWQWGGAGLLAYVLIGPLANFLLGYWYVSRLPKAVFREASTKDLMRQWGAMLRLGVPVMGAALVSALVQLWMRVEVGSVLGNEALGYFQAAWTISMQYIGFVLAAMSADYFPRLTGVINNHKAAVRLVNEQTEIAMLLSMPVFIAMTGLAPWVVQLLYSSAFVAAVDVFRWQIIGDVLKVASWPLAYVFLAAGSSKTYFCAESIVLVLMGGLVAGFSSRVGLQITGMAFLACYVVYLPLVYFLAKRKIAFQWQKRVRLLLISVLILCCLGTFLSTYYWWGSIITVGLAMISGYYSLFRLTRMSDFSGSLGRIGILARRLANVFHKR